MDNKELDVMIKGSLTNSADEIIPQDRFEHIKAGINESKKGGRRYGFLSSLNFNFRKTAAAITCSIFVFAGFSLAFSEDARVIAADTVSKIKTIFVLDKVDGEYKVVEKNTDDVKGNSFSVSRSTVLSETEIENMVGFKIHFPESIDGFKLVDRGIGLSLQKQISFDTAQRLKQNMEAAVDDEVEFKKLREYKPIRHINGTYKDNDRLILIAANNSKTWQKDIISKSNNIKDVKIGDLDGKWIDLPLPIYSTNSKEIEWFGFSSQKPTEIKLMHYLTWKMGNVNYMITTYDNKSEATLDDLIKTSQTFMANMNNTKDFKSTIIYEVKDGKVAKDSMKEMAGTLKSRFEAFGFKKVVAKAYEEKRIELTVTGDQMLDSVAAIAGNRNQLKFVGPNDEDMGLTEKDIKGATIINGSLLIEFNKDGKAKLLDATTKLIDKPLSVFLDDKLLTSPVVRAPIADGRIMLTGMESAEDMRRVATIFKCGKALDVPLSVVAIEAVD